MHLALALQLVALAAGVARPVAPKIDSSGVEAVVGERSVALSLCYEDGRKKNASLAGNVAVEMNVSEQGTVIDAKSIRGTTLPDKAVVGCVVDVMKSLDFGKQDKPQTVRYTLRFYEEPPKKED